jgi:dienelactone hydrolase
MRFAAAYNKPSSLLHTIFIKPFYLIASLLLVAGEAYHTRRSKSRPVVFDFMRRLRADPATADTKIGVAGFCWGGQYAILLGQNDSGPGSMESKPLVDSVFTAHPARFEIPGDVVKVKVPLSMALASNDLWVSRKEAKILEKVEKKEPYEAVVFEGTTHGFALRNNEEDEVEVAAAEKAEEQALSWFKKWIG